MPYDANEYGAGRYYIYTSMDMRYAAFTAAPVARDGKAELLLNAAKGNYGYIQIYRLDGKILVRHQYRGDGGWSADYYIVAPRGLKLILNVEACVRDEMSVYEMS